MRIKEAAEQSGLTEKAIRLYEEKGLITPTITEINGRKFRDYDKDTVALLKTIGGLRRSFFSLDQIAAMQESPDRIPEIFSQYRNELKEQYDRLGMLIARADEILAQLPEADFPDHAVVTPAALRDVDTLSEAMTAVTPVVVSEEIPVSAPPKGRKEHAEVHFKRWDEEISTDEREIVYQRYLEYYSRWEKRYAAELAVGTVFDWLGRRKKLVISLLTVCLFGLLVYHTGIYTDYDRTFDGYMLVYDYFHQTDDVYDEPLWTEPVTIRLNGRIRHYLFRNDIFEGQILSEKYRPHDIWHHRFFAWEDHITKEFTLYSPLTDRHNGYRFDWLFSGFDLRAEDGSELMCVYTFPTKDEYCFEVDNITYPETGKEVRGFIILPAATPEEAEDWFHNVLRAAWQKEYEYKISKYNTDS